MGRLLIGVAIMGLLAGCASSSHQLNSGGVDVGSATTPGAASTSRGGTGSTSGGSLGSGGGSSGTIGTGTGGAPATGR